MAEDNTTGGDNVENLNRNNTQQKKPKSPKEQARDAIIEDKRKQKRQEISKAVGEYNKADEVAKNAITARTEALAKVETLEEEFLNIDKEVPKFEALAE